MQMPERFWMIQSYNITLMKNKLHTYIDVG
jgi:hypothetical protein